jgi:hypothetical protein
MPNSNDSQVAMMLTLLAFGLFMIGLLNWVLYEYLFSRDYRKLMRFFLALATVLFGCYGACGLVSRPSEQLIGSVLVGSSLIALSILAGRSPELTQTTTERD